jgi:putative ABC transport system permease protein
MVKHYFKVTFRHIRKHLLISILNIAGLAIGIACFVLILLYVNYELNYDKFNEHYDDIFRIGIDAKFGNTTIRQTWTPAPLPAAMYEEFPEIRAITRIGDWAQTINVDERIFNESRAAMVDSSFTEIFTLDYVEGAPGKQLNEPGQVLLDRSTAEKYFGDLPAVGQTLLFRDTVPLTVTGVYEDIPAQSHFHFNMLISLVSAEGIYNSDNWGNNRFETYMRLQPGFPKEDLETKFPDFLNKYLFNGEYFDFADEENYWIYYLQHIREIHLGSDLNGEFEPNGNIAYVRIFSVVAFLVLVVACINFMNLTTASSSIRAREVGVRKTNGASRRLLSEQFFAEAVIISILALILAMGLVESLMGTFQSFTGKEISLRYLDNFLVIPGLLALAIIVGLLSGTYPALYMSRFTAVESLGYEGIKQGRSWFRNILVLFQFSVAIFLIAATFVVQKQVNLIMDESLGFNKEQVLLVPDIYYVENPETWLDELRKVPEISAVALSSHVPGDQITNWGFRAEGVDANFSLNATITNESYLEVMGIEIVEGRYFSEDFGSDSTNIILNETAVRDLGLSDPIGMTFYLWSDQELPHKVIGVVKDHHWESKHAEVRPMALMRLGCRGWSTPRYMSVRYMAGDFSKVLQVLEDQWKALVPQIPFQYEFLDEHYEAIYNNEKQTRSLLYFFAGIAIFISCLGLFGLASFMADRRTKEIGIRKTNGATTSNILRLLSLDFTKWVLLANIIAWPLTWLAMRKWLESFAYRVDIPLWTFLAAGIIAFLIAIATVSYHALRASQQNPSMSLRYE